MPLGRGNVPVLPTGQPRRYCQLPVSARRMQWFLQSRLASHQLQMYMFSDVLPELSM